MVRALAVAAFVLTACSLTTSLDGLSGGGPAPPAPPGEHDAGRARPPATTDAGASKDASTDGSVATTSAYAQAVLADAPSLYLRFGEPNGTTAVKNEVGATTAQYPSGITLGVAGALAGDPDTAIAFKGGILELPPGQECGNGAECAVELWVMLDEYQDGYGWVVDHQIWDPERRGWLLETLNGGLTYERWNGASNSAGVGSQVQIPLHEWHHYVMVSDVQGMRIYYDGEQKERHADTLEIPTLGTKWTIGGTACFDCASRSWLKGAVDELAFYDHSLTEERIQAHVAAARPK